MRCFAALFSIVTGFAAFSIFATIRLASVAFATVFTIMAGFTAFTVFAAIRFCIITCSSGTIIFAAAMQLIIRFIGSFYITGIITCCGNGLLYLSSIGS